jgi:hypothetical protein
MLCFDKLSMTLRYLISLHFFPFGKFAASYGLIARWHDWKIIIAKIRKSTILVFIVAD